MCTHMHALGLIKLKGHSLLASHGIWNTDMYDRSSQKILQISLTGNYYPYSKKKRKKEKGLSKVKPLVQNA